MYALRVYKSASVYDLFFVCVCVWTVSIVINRYSSWHMDDIIILIYIKKDCRGCAALCSGTRYGIQTDGWVDGWVGGWMGGWMDGCIILSDTQRKNMQPLRLMQRCVRTRVAVGVVTDEWQLVCLLLHLSVVQFQYPKILPLFDSRAGLGLCVAQNSSVEWSFWGCVFRYKLHLVVSVSRWLCNYLLPL